MTRPLDLRHVISPAVRDLIELVHLPDFERTFDQIKRVHGCARPVQLVGQTATLDADTRAVLRSYSTADEPTGRLLTTCGNRRASRCPACSRVYAADTYHLIKAGLSGGKTVPETVAAHPRVFVTLTAPSFGPVHNRPTTPNGKRMPCRCGQHHTSDEPVLGTPTHPTTYDYAGAVLWNAHAGALWARFTTYLRRAVAAALGVKQQDLKDLLRVSFAKVAEYQKRGLVHFHAVIRFDGPEGSNQPPPAGATADVLATAVRQAHSRAVVPITSDAVGDLRMRWGRELDVQRIAAFGDGELTDGKVAAYVAKYATKSAEGSGTVDRSLFCRTCNGRGFLPGPDGFRDQCEDCEGTGQAEPLAGLAVQHHVRQMIRTCWDLGQRPEFAELKLWKWAHMLGFRGHFSTKSRRYSTTLSALRDVRRDWSRERAAAHAGPVPDEATTLVVSQWAYRGSGYRPGEELLAATVRHQIEQARDAAARVKTEGEIWR